MTQEANETTRAVRAALETDTQHGAVVPPIHLTSTFAFVRYGQKRGYDYSRSGNPTRDALAGAVERISWLAHDLGARLIDLEINPLIVGRAAGGATAVDGRATLNARADAGA